jgi:hypothetical protein
MPHSFPKIIWQTHNHKKEWLPVHLNQIAATWVNLNPGWEYRYVDQVQRDATVRKYPEIYEFYQYRLPMIQSDIWRFIITYEYGGCYADMDSVCSKPLDFMLEDIQGDPEMITVPEHKGQGNTHNYIVKANSPLMKSVVDKMSQTDKFNPFNSLEPFDIFVKTAYSYPNVLKTFNAANHSLDYKKNFLLGQHLVNDYGQEIKYLDFLEKNGLSPSL